MSSTDVDDRSVSRIGNGAAQDFMGEWCGIAFAEKHKSHDVRDRVALFPLEIGVRKTTSVFFQLNQDSGDRVGDDRTLANRTRFLPRVRPSTQRVCSDS